jgi:hypothetical protein
MPELPEKISKNGDGRYSCGYCNIFTYTRQRNVRQHQNNCGMKRHEEKDDSDEELNHDKADTRNEISDDEAESMKNLYYLSDIRKSLVNFLVCKKRNKSISCSVPTLRYC